MTAPLHPAAREVVSAGRDGIEPSADELARGRDRLLAAIAAGGAATAASSVAKASTATAGAKLSIVAAVAVGVAAAGGGAWWLLKPSTQTQTQTISTPTPTPTPDPIPSPIPIPIPIPIPSTSPIPSPIPSTIPSPRTRTTPRDQKTSLKDELELLQRAKKAMKKTPRDAVALLERYVHLFPNGSLLPEAEFMRIEAACALGEDTMVEKLRASFATRWPDSPLTVRAAEICVP